MLSLLCSCMWITLPWLVLAVSPVRESPRTSARERSLTRGAVGGAGQGWKFCIFREPRSEPKKIKEPKKLEVKGGEREKEKRRGKKEKRG